MRLIDADALKEKLSSLTMTITGFRGEKSFLHECMMAYRKIVLHFVDDAPTIEAEPVRHGRWIDDRTDIVCSVCKTAFSDEITFMKRAIDNEYPKRCPECGAKMDGGASDAGGAE